MLIRILIYALAAYGIYMLFFKNKRIVIEDKNPKSPKEKNYSDYEEL